MRLRTRLLALALAAACQGPPAARAPAAAAPPPDSVPCFVGDPMPTARPDARRYTMRVYPPDSTRAYTMREQRVPLCPADSAPP
ncbi:hypothetical protein [Roseisolibacter sp. H3M3-2]|uniref:hypothetical protein n=1 Tax=Roseisolibacter sp. H3M3-2 TaxID=3031323 RepID=UPI0023D9EC6F|nr:hypothetical protein [Roseisolibacter sp. H3M3-2]MDF1504353.1 hypothetical protein [Roseisolibacter sp. H3M3-2]